MSAIAELVALLLSTGIPPESVSAAVELAQRHHVEQVEFHRNSTGIPPETTAERRKAWDRERKRKNAETKNVDILTSLSSSLLTEETLKKERKKESSGIRARDAAAVPDDWPENYGDLFWQAYPRKEEKISAMKKLANLRKSGIVTFSDLMAGVTRYCSVPREPQFIKQPTVWLNKGCWADETQTGAINGHRTGNTRTTGHDAILAVAARKARELDRNDDMARTADPAGFAPGNGADRSGPVGNSDAVGSDHGDNQRFERDDQRIREGEVIPPDEDAAGFSGRWRLVS